MNYHYCSIDVLKGQVNDDISPLLSSIFLRVLYNKWERPLQSRGLVWTFDCLHRLLLQQLPQFVLLCSRMRVNTLISPSELSLGVFQKDFLSPRARRDDGILSTFFCRCISKQSPVFVTLTSLHKVPKWLSWMTHIWIKTWRRNGTMESILTENTFFALRWIV